MGNNSLPIRINKNNFLQTKLKKLGSFDVKFTREPVSLNPGPKDIDVDHEQFKGFSYTNSEFCKVTVFKSICPVCNCFPY